MADLEALLASLQEENAKLEHEFQGTCREARSSQIKADEAENLLDDKRNVKDDVAKAIEKEEQKKREMLLREESNQLMQENAKLRSTETWLMSNIDDLVGRLREHEPDEVPNFTSISPVKKEEPKEEDENHAQFLPLLPISPPQASFPTSPIQPSDNLSTVPNFTHGNPTTPKVKKEEEPVEGEIIHDVIEKGAHDSIGEEEPIENEMLNDDVNIEMSDAGMEFEDLTNQPFNNRDSAQRTAQPSDLIDDDMILNGEMAEVHESSIVEMDSLETDNVEHVDGMDQSETYETEHEHSMVDDLIGKEGKADATIANVKEISKTVDEKRRRSSRNVTRIQNYIQSEEDSDIDGVQELEYEMRKGRNPSRNVSRPVKFADSLEESDEDEGPLVKKSRKKAADEANCANIGFTVNNLPKSTTPQCVLCERYPTTVYGYAEHLNSHKSTLNRNGIYLLCYCGVEVHSVTRTLNHRECDGRQFTLHKKVSQTTAQCPLCEMYPLTASRYAYHLYNAHKSSLQSNGIFLLCSCGIEVRSVKRNPNHSKECDGREFTIHKLGEK